MPGPCRALSLLLALRPSVRPRSPAPQPPPLPFIRTLTSAWHEACARPLQAESWNPLRGMERDILQITKKDTPKHSLATSAAKHDNAGVTLAAKAALSVAMVIMSRWAGGVPFALVGVGCAAVLLWTNWRYPPYAPMGMPMAQLPAPPKGTCVAVCCCPCGVTVVISCDCVALSHRVCGRLLVCAL